MPFSCIQLMGKFEYGLAGVMAFLILGILGLIVISPEGQTIELKENMNNMETSEPKSTTTISLGEAPIDPEPEVTIGESLQVEIHETESDQSEMIDESESKIMEEKPKEKMDEMTDSYSVIIPEGVGIPGCEETNECYLPPSISIKSGYSVIWINEDTAAHTVTSGTVDGGPDGVFDSSIFLSGATFEHTFSDAGNYDYFCIVHPWMTGTIEVS